MEATATVVIKVKYGDMLRRFDAQVVDEELNFNIDGLRQKILSLFGVAPDAEIMLTYIDEDHDVVALVDDDDLRDVVKQYLNPVRITVKLISEKTGGQIDHSSGSSMPLRSTEVQQPLQDLQDGIFEFLKTVPEPLYETLMNLFTGLTSMASLSAPCIAEVVDYLSKVGLSYLDLIFESQTGEQSSTDSDDPENSLAQTETDGSDLSTGSSYPRTGPSNGGEERAVESNEILSNPQPEVTIEKNKVKLLVTGGSMEASSSKAIGLKGVPSALDALDINVGKEENDKKISEFCSHPNYHFNEPAEPHVGSKTVNIVSLLPASQAVTSRTSSSQNDSIGVVFHHGVHCNVCGIHPITGPRFKSKVQVDYDLCSICFSRTGNDRDYIRMDHPVGQRNHVSYKGLNDSVCDRAYWIKTCASKLDSLFIHDLNVVDGTIMAPLTPFTKIWRMRNNGVVAWPQKTQLVWIGGDRLSNHFSVEVEIPAAGLAVDEELDISVDLLAPEIPGQYISYWRMVSPSGQRFGQRIWVLIQVEASLKETPRESFWGLNLYLPVSRSSLIGPEIINADTKPIVEDSQPKPTNYKKMAELVETVVDPQPNDFQEMKFPTNDSLLVGNGASSSVPFAELCVPSIRMLDPRPPPAPIVSVHESEVELAGKNAGSVAPSPFPSVPIIDMPEPPSSPVTSSSEESAVEFPGNKEVEEQLLWELEQMGFKEVNLNKEVLRMNEYDLEQTVNDLCGVAEWDTLLEELEEMGFYDTEMNKMLLKKNNGSIKHVVMDLIAWENS